MNEPKEDFNLNTYSPSEVEKKWQKIWEDSNAFKAIPDKEGEPFCVVIPPPNVTGSLHMGHAFNTSLIDVIVRFQRLNGKNVLCLPGTDMLQLQSKQYWKNKLRMRVLIRMI